MNNSIYIPKVGKTVLFCKVCGETSFWDTEKDGEIPYYCPVCANVDSIDEIGKICGEVNGNLTEEDSGNKEEPIYVNRKRLAALKDRPHNLVKGPAVWHTFPGENWGDYNIGV